MYRVTVCEEHLQNAKIDLEDLIQTALTLRKVVSHDQDRRMMIEEIIA
jgi:hypothetical protein